MLAFILCLYALVNVACGYSIQKTQEEENRHVYLMRLSRNFTEELEKRRNFSGYSEAENSNVDISHILTDLKDDPGYSHLLDIKPVDRRAQGPGWVSLANTEIQSGDGFHSEQRRLSPDRFLVDAATKRTKPSDVVGFSVVRATEDSRAPGDKRILFENTLVDSNYGWDSRESLLEVHFPGLYFLSFSLTADAAASDSFKVSLLKNGVEMVSVQGRADSESRNSGISGSSSIILDLVQGDRVWLQLIRGGLMEAGNRKSGYTAFSGYRLGCDMLDEDDITADIMNSIQSVHQSLPSLPGENQEHEEYRPVLTTTEPSQVILDLGKDKNVDRDRFSYDKNWDRTKGGFWNEDKMRDKYWNQGKDKYWNEEKQNDKFWSGYGNKYGSWNDDRNKDGSWNGDRNKDGSWDADRNKVWDSDRESWSSNRDTLKHKKN
ncbi:uncharacterized protein LOC111696028 [Eurytemora carolleeae]|uniref:uncharacterized protein LOC111696028 n=1 Tax=Eurytemora carolleeae TaxID=1294199 RepID=UPI000C77C51A|nr:uncharacterized protein LOC111696028 [Eurytemora carolleeae]|eukprot:XP_023321313.1 uncharacterized protein LOC111696028 [Eurytemora affinis]